MVVLEVGLGGRLDATNSVYTALSVITSIQFDHTNVLGNSLAEIATEKCGIFRMMTPALIGPQVPFSVAQVSCPLCCEYYSAGFSVFLLSAHR